MLHVGNTPTTQVLREHAARWEKLHLAQIIDGEAQLRAELALDAGPLRLDFARQRLDAAVISDLIALAEVCELPAAMAAMCRGDEINQSEGRAVLHSALRSAECGDAVRDQVVAEQQRMRQLVDGVLAGEICNAAGQTYTDVINIGIGGSDLGPRLVVDALAGLEPSEDGLRAHFLGNPDAADLTVRLRELDPRRCLCVIASKSFTTLETQLVADHVRQWLTAGGGDVARQCVAVTAAVDKAVAFGIPAEKTYAMWDWVGGRFSLWSTVGLSAALALGWSRFEQLLAGAATMDKHFFTTPLDQNLPVIWGLIGIWNRNFLSASSQVTAVYSERLGELPNWLQQLEMESNGKSVGRDGNPLTHATSPVQWGGVGTSVQHAFFQMLHQGTEAHPVDFILPRVVPGGDAAMQSQLLGNALAQSAALSHGRDGRDGGHEGAAAAWRQFDGNRPSSLIWLERLDAFSLGALLAAYEHRCFVQGWLWGLNSFDQFGVELGKVLARAIDAALNDPAKAWPDPLLAQQARRLVNSD